MHERPAEISDDDVRRALHESWAIAGDVDYAAVGFGSHHWILRAGATRWFVTVDDLAHKPMLGHSVDEVAGRLSTAYRAVHELHADGLEFAVAPLPPATPDRPGELVVRLGERWAMSVLPYVDGTTWGFDGVLPPERRDELVGLLARLHAAPPPVGLQAHRTPAGREALERLLVAADEPWRGGPYAEAARAWALEHRQLVRHRVAALDAVVARVRPADLVVTHGEPHPGNLVGAVDGLRLVDWDTVALAPRERDLWLVGRDDGTVSAYEAASGHAVDRALLAAYRLAWDLADVASFLDELHGPHADTADARAAVGFLAGLELAPLPPSA